MNPQTLAEARRIFSSVKKGIKNAKNVEKVICPPFVYLSTINPEGEQVPCGAGNQQSVMKLGGQDVFYEQQGAFTGEVSPTMLRALGCEYVIVGHSERRQYLAETDQIVNKKLKAALSAKLTPILCVGESQKEREQGDTEKVLKRQVISGLKNWKSDLGPRPGLRLKAGLRGFYGSRPILAYEPLWAIGAGKACSTEEARQVRLFLQEMLARLYGASGKNVALLYGGSVKAKNAASFITGAGFQGVLVGGASLDAVEFAKIVNAVNAVNTVRQ